MNTKTVLGIATVLIILNAIYGNVNTTNQSTSTSTVVEKKTVNSTYAMRGTDNTWPRLSQNNTAVNDQLTQSNYYLVFDGSGSMKDSACSGKNSKLNAAKEAVMVFIDKIPDAANIGLYGFDNTGKNERVALHSGEKENLKQSVAQLMVGGGTPLRSAITAGFNALTKQAEKQLGYGEYHLVVITDGEASDGEDPKVVVGQLLEQSPVTLHTIGFCIDRNHILNQPGLTIYKTASNPEELTLGLEQVLAEAPSFDITEFKEQVR